MIFAEKYFKQTAFANEQIEKYFASACKDLKIAEVSDVSDVKFQFAYNALIKLGIALTACFNYKVSSTAGHHIKIMEKISEILKNDEILIHGNQMRTTRNTELYNGGVLITEKQAAEYVEFVLNLLNQTKLFINRKRSKLYL